MLLGEERENTAVQLAKWHPGQKGKQRKRVSDLARVKSVSREKVNKKGAKVCLHTCVGPLIQ